METSKRKYFFVLSFSFTLYSLAAQAVAIENHKQHHRTSKCSSVERKMSCNKNKSVYVKAAIQLPVIREHEGFIDKPKLRPIYSLALGKEFAYAALELEGFYTQLPSNTVVTRSYGTREYSTYFRSSGLFVNLSKNLIEQKNFNLSAGIGCGFAYNTMGAITAKITDSVGTFSNSPVSSHSSFKPVFQVFTGISYNINDQNFIGVDLKYMYLNSFSGALFDSQVTQNYARGRLVNIGLSFKHLL